MKRITTFLGLALCFLALSVNAQHLLPNGNFEIWHGVTDAEKITTAPMYWSQLVVASKGNAAILGPLAPEESKYDKTPASGVNDSMSLKTVTYFQKMSDFVGPLCFGLPATDSILFPGYIVTGEFQLNVEQQQQVPNYYTNIPLKRFPDIFHYADSSLMFLRAVQNAIAIKDPEKQPKKLTGYVKYVAGDNDFSNPIKPKYGKDRPLVAAFTVIPKKSEDGKTILGAGEIIAMGISDTSICSAQENDWKKFSIDIKPLQGKESRLTDATHFYVIILSSNYRENMRTASGNGSTLRFDDIMTDQEIIPKSGIQSVNVNTLDFKVIPTVTKGEITLELPVKEATITVYNTAGFVVLKKDCVNGETLTIPNNGSYVVRASCNGQQGIQKVVVVK